MLTRLEIENVAVIERTEISFGAGLHVLTGETGAGKSIIIDSIELVLGERASRDMIRTGAQCARVFAEFSDLSPETVALLSEFGYEPESDGTLLISREVQADGRSSARIGGRPVSASALRDIGRSLITIHGQHNNQSLLSPDTHVRYLDAFAKNGELLESYAESYREVSKLRSELASLQSAEKEKEGRIDYLTYQIEEIERAQVEPGEDEALAERRSMLVNAERISAAAESAYDALYGREDSAQTLLSQSAADLEGIGRYTQRFSGLAERLRGLQYELEDCVPELRELKDELEFDPGLLEQIERRLDVFYRLKRKYGSSADEILAYLEKARGELAEIELAGERAERLAGELKEKTAVLSERAAALTESRRRAAERLCGEVMEELRFLDMPGARFEAAVEPAEGFTAQGADKVEFYISTNIGEDPKPLARVASGGELSRIMLGIKNVLAEGDPVATLIFDEIDAGVSGRAAQKIGLKLKQLSRGRQIVCVTHLAQIAAFADRHLLISKGERGGRTYTGVTDLDRQGRERELARIMGGIDVTDTMLRTAAELLDTSDALVNART